MRSSCSGTPARTRSRPPAPDPRATISRSPPRSPRPARSSASRSWSARGERTSTCPPAVSRPTGPWSTSLPRWMTTTSSTVCATSASTWLETSTVRPSRGQPRRKSRSQRMPCGIEAVGGLVEDEHPRVAEQRGGEPEPLAHAERVLARAAAAASSSSTSSSTSSRATRGGRPRRAARAGGRGRVRPGCAPAASRFGADAPRRSVELRVRAAVARGAGGRPRKAEDHPQRGGLAGAVRAEEPGHGARAGPRTTGRRPRPRRRSAWSAHQRRWLARCRGPSRLQRNGAAASELGPLLSAGLQRSYTEASRARVRAPSIRPKSRRAMS